jgi:hypothetical protein
MGGAQLEEARRPEKMMQVFPGTNSGDRLEAKRDGCSLLIDFLKHLLTKFHLKPIDK